jgi:hypothetical protein
VWATVARREDVDGRGSPAPMADRRGAHGAATADSGEGAGSTGRWRRPGGHTTRRRTGGRAHGVASDFGFEVATAAPAWATAARREDVVGRGSDGG